MKTIYCLVDCYFIPHFNSFSEHFDKFPFVVIETLYYHHPFSNIGKSR